MEQPESPPAPGRVREERSTDGKIAINEDTHHAVFSRLFGPGQPPDRPARGLRRTRGAPLFASRPAEFVQGHNDLVTAVAGVEKAQSRLVLAQAAESASASCWRSAAARPGSRAGAVRPGGAQGDLRAAEIALAAVRNRLRILGRTDDEIAKLEARPHRRRGHSSARRSPARSSSARSASASTSMPAPPIRCSRSATSSSSG